MLFIFFTLSCFSWTIQSQTKPRLVSKNCVFFWTKMRSMFVTDESFHSQFESLSVGEKKREMNAVIVWMTKETRIVLRQFSCCRLLHFWNTHFQTCTSALVVWLASIEYGRLLVMNTWLYRALDSCDISHNIVLSIFPYCIQMPACHEDRQTVESHSLAWITTSSWAYKGVFKQVWLLIPTPHVVLFLDWTHLAVSRIWHHQQQR